jgi:hypothetical protein
MYDDDHILEGKLKTKDALVLHADTSLACTAFAKGLHSDMPHLDCSQ